MPKVEVDEAELQQLRQVQSFTNNALKNPATRAELLRIQKTLDPSVVIPEIDAADAVRKDLKGVEDRMEAFLKRQEERDANEEERRREGELQNRMRQGQEFLRSNGYTADGIAKVEALMVQEGIISYAAGQALYERLNPPSAPADHSRNNRFSGPTDHNIRSDDYKGLWESQGNSEEWLEESLRTVRAEFNH